MAGGLFDIGISGLQASQRALATASHNIANVNTEGYSRQRVEFSTRDPQATGIGFFGSGVQVERVQRIFDDSLTFQVRTSTAAHSQLQEFFSRASEVDNLLGDSNAGLMPNLQSFFDAVQSVANDPASAPARQVLLSKAQTLEDRFHYLDQRLDEQNKGAGTALTSEVSHINSLTKAIAGVNKDIVQATSAGNGTPNDLMDRRDSLITKLSEHVSVTTAVQDDGSVNLFVGNGQAVVAGFQSRQLSVTANAFDPQRLEVGFVTNKGDVVISDQISGGTLGGVLEFRNQVLDPARNSLGRLAAGLTLTFNAQHRNGMDLNGTLGGDFFAPLQDSVPQVFGSTGNKGVPPAQISVKISDSGALTASDYRLTRNGASYVLTRLSDNTVTTLSTFPGGSETKDGLNLTLNSGVIADGDSYLIQPVRAGAHDFSVTVSDIEKIAAAGAIRTGASLANTGKGRIDAGVLSDATSYVSDKYTIIIGGATSAATGGAIGTITDDPATANTLRYQIVINGTVVYSQNEGAAPLADLPSLASVINDDTATTGVRARVNAAGTALYLSNEPQSALPVNVSEQLVDINSPALPLDAGDTATGYFGSVLTGSTPNNALSSISGTADSYLVVDSSGKTVTSGPYVTGAQITFNGIQTSIDGQANNGDLFSVAPNANGVGDNRNALQLAGLQTRLLLNGRSASFGDAYNQLVADVGSKTQRADVNRVSQKSLLDQAIQARETKSGVNLDEEAADLLRFQQTYQAAARVIAAADSMLQVLFDVVRR